MKETRSLQGIMKTFQYYVQISSTSLSGAIANFISSWFYLYCTAFHICRPVWSNLFILDCLTRSPYPNSVPCLSLKSELWSGYNNDWNNHLCFRNKLTVKGKQVLAGNDKNSPMICAHLFLITFWCHNQWQVWRSRLEFCTRIAYLETSMVLSFHLGCVTFLTCEFQIINNFAFSSNRKEHIKD